MDSLAPRWIGWHGELPVEFGRAGMRYAEVVDDSAEGIDELRDELREARGDITALWDATLAERRTVVALEDRVRELMVTQE